MTAEEETEEKQGEIVRIVLLLFLLPAVLFHTFWNIYITYIFVLCCVMS
jgi:hypothetical protein